MNKFDVIVVGGGVAGVSAALSAKKEGLNVCLIEKGSILGGLATSGLINWFEPLCDGLGNQLIFSQCDEFFNLSIKYGYSTLDNNWKNNGKRKSSWFDHNLFALTLNKLLNDNNIHIEYETLVTDCLITDKKIEAIEINNIEGKKHLYAKSFVDASGNGILFRKANINVRPLDNYLTYATTTYKKGIDKPIFQYSGANAYGKNHPEGMKYFYGLKQDDVNEYLTLGQQLALKEYEEGKLKDISALPSMPQFRRICSIEGENILKGVNKNKYQEDSIGVIGVFSTPKDYYEIPIGTLYNNKINNLFACGRIISADDEAFEAIRVIPVAILTGEVASILIKHYLNNSFDISNIQKHLIQRGIKLHY